jgi:hypothetical protein
VACGVPLRVAPRVRRAGYSGEWREGRMGNGIVKGSSGERGTVASVVGAQLRGRVASDMSGRVASVVGAQLRGTMP